MSLFSRTLAQLTGISREPSLVSDGTLLDRFLRGKEERAFEELIRRHGKMVYAVAVRVVRDKHAAEDVFQATFLVLAQDARRIRHTESLAAWLHGAALRLAKKSLRRRHKLVSDKVAVDSLTVDPIEEIGTAFHQQVLDEELQSLPAHYREPLVLHFLEGLTYEETARSLGITLGAVEGRIKRGKRELHLRLARRGVGLGIALTAMAWSASAAQAAVGPAIMHSSVLGAAAVAQGIPFAAVCSSEAVQLAAKETAMFTLGKSIIVASGLALSAGAGWMAAEGNGQGVAGEGRGGVMSTDLEAGINAPLEQPIQVAQGEAGSVPKPDAAPEIFTIKVGPDGKLLIEGLLKVGGVQAGPEGRVQMRGVGDGVNSDAGVQGTISFDALQMLGGEQGLLRLLQRPAGDAQPQDMLPEQLNQVKEQASPQVAMPARAMIPVSPLLEPQEDRIYQVLHVPMMNEINEIPLRKVVEFLAARHGIPILLDKTHLDEEGITGDETLSLNVTGIPVRKALKMMLENVNDIPLTFVVEDEVLKITTQSYVDHKFVTKIYDVSEFEFEQDKLADVVRETVAGKWQNLSQPSGDVTPSPNPRGGLIKFFNGSLIVRQSHPVHEEIQSLLIQLLQQSKDRQARQAGAQAPVPYYPSVGSPYLPGQPVPQLVPGANPNNPDGARLYNSPYPGDPAPQPDAGPRPVVPKSPDDFHPVPENNSTPLRNPAPEPERNFTGRVRLSESEHRIEMALSSPLEQSVDVLPMREVVEYVRARYGIQMMIDVTQLRVEGLDGSEELSCPLSNLPLRNALKLMLRDVNSNALTYVIEDDVLKITTRAYAESKYVNRIYQFADLQGMDVSVLSSILTGTSGTWKPFANNSDEMKEAFFHLPKFSPESEGAVIPTEDGMAMMIRQTLAVHAEIEEVLRQFYEYAHAPRRKLLLEERLKSKSNTNLEPLVEPVPVDQPEPGWGQPVPGVNPTPNRNYGVPYYPGAANPPLQPLPQSIHPTPKPDRPLNPNPAL